MFKWFRSLFVTAGMMVMLVLWSAGDAMCADFRAVLMFSRGDQPPENCGEAFSCGELARLDVDLGELGRFTLLLDARAARMQVFSWKLNTYVDIPVEGDGHDWRELIKSAASLIMPQSMGLVDIVEKERLFLEEERLDGYRAKKYREVFELSFMGTFRTVTLEVWESEAFAPFPLKAVLLDPRPGKEGRVWLASAEKGKIPPDLFRLPEKATRYGSVMELLLNVLTVR